jgi:Tol biopolymer transport system component
MALGLAACGGGGDSPQAPAAEAAAERAVALANEPPAPTGPSGGALSLASSSAAGRAADGTVCAISGDGGKVLFTSRSAALVSGDTNSAADIFLTDLNGNGVSRVVAAADSTQRLVCLGMTPDAGAVVYATSTVYPPPALFVQDLTTGARAQVTPPAGSLANVRGFQFAGISDDGRRLAFVALPTVGGSAYNPVVNGPARMMFAEVASGRIVYLEAQVRLQTTPYGLLAGDVQLSPNGGALAFTTSAAYPEAGDTTAHGDVYLLDIEAGNVTLASTDADGQQIAILGFENGAGPALGVQGFLAGGHQLAFRYPNDTSAGRAGVFVKDLGSGTLARVLDDGIAAVTRSWRMALSFSDDGGKVAFVERSGNTATGTQIPRVRDLAAGTLLNAATSAQGTVGNGDTSVNALLSRDGTAAAFDSNSTNLAPGATTNVLRAWRKLLQP